MSTTRRPVVRQTPNRLHTLNRENHPCFNPTPHAQRKAKNTPCTATRTRWPPGRSDERVGRTLLGESCLPCGEIIGGAREDDNFAVISFTLGGSCNWGTLDVLWGGRGDRCEPSTIYLVNVFRVVVELQRTKNEIRHTT